MPLGLGGLGGRLNSLSYPAEHQRPLTEEEEERLRDQLLRGTLGTLGYIGGILDKPGRAIRGGLDALFTGDPYQAREMLSIIPFSDMAGLTNPSEAVSGRNLLEGVGILNENIEGFSPFDEPEDALGDVAGFAAEVALDPFSYMTMWGKAGGKGLDIVKKLGIDDNLLKRGVRKAEDVSNLTGGRLRRAEARNLTREAGGDALRPELIYGRQTSRIARDVGSVLLDLDKQGLEATEGVLKAGADNLMGPSPLGNKIDEAAHLVGGEDKLFAEHMGKFDTKPGEVLSLDEQRRAFEAFIRQEPLPQDIFNKLENIDNSQHQIAGLIDDTHGIEEGFAGPIAFRKLGAVSETGEAGTFLHRSTGQQLGGTFGVGSPFKAHSSKFFGQGNLGLTVGKAVDGLIEKGVMSPAGRGVKALFDYGSRDVYGAFSQSIRNNITSRLKGTVGAKSVALTGRAAKTWREVDVDGHLTSHFQRFPKEEDHIRMRDGFKNKVLREIGEGSYSREVESFRQNFPNQFRSMQGLAKNLRDSIDESFQGRIARGMVPPEQDPLDFSYYVRHAPLKPDESNVAYAENLGKMRAHNDTKRNPLTMNLPAHVHDDLVQDRTLAKMVENLATVPKSQHAARLRAAKEYIKRQYPIMEGDERYIEKMFNDGFLDDTQYPRPTRPDKGTPDNPLPTHGYRSRWGEFHTGNATARKSGAGYQLGLDTLIRRGFSPIPINPQTMTPAEVLRLTTARDARTNVMREIWDELGGATSPQIMQGPEGQHAFQVMAEAKMQRIKDWDARAEGLVEYLDGIHKNYGKEMELDKALPYNLFYRQPILDASNYVAAADQINATADAGYDMIGKYAGTGRDAAVTAGEEISLFDAMTQAGQDLRAKFTQTNPFTGEANDLSMNTYQQLTETLRKNNPELAANIPAIDTAVLEAGQAAGAAPEAVEAMRNMVKEYTNFFKEVTVPKQIIDDWGRAITMMEPGEALNPTLEFFDKALRWTKTGWTVPWPAFHTRNFMTGMWMAYVGGAHDAAGGRVGGIYRSLRSADQMLKGNYESDWFTGLADDMGVSHMTDADAAEYVADLAARYNLVSSSQIRQELTAAAKGELDVLRAPGEEIAEKVGLVPGQTPASITTPLAENLTPGALMERGREKVGKRGTTRGKVASAAATPIEAVVEGGKGYGDLIEGYNRLTPFISYLRQGYSPEAAAAMVKKLNVDYGAMTRFEKQAMKRVFPFYAFTRGMIPVVLKEMMENPGGPQGKFIRGALNIRENEGGFLPPHIANGMAIPLGNEDEEGYRYYMMGMDLPHENILELMRVEGTLAGTVGATIGGLAGQMHPWIQKPIELGTGKHLYSGRDIRDLEGSMNKTMENMAELTSYDGKYVFLPESLRPYLEAGVMQGSVKTLGETVVGASPASRVTSTAKKFTQELIAAKEADGAMATAGTTIRALADIATGVRIQRSDIESSRITGIRNVLGDQLADIPWAKNYTDISIPTEHVGRLSPEQMLLYRYKNQLRRDARRKSRQRQLLELSR